MVRHFQHFCLVILLHLEGAIVSLLLQKFALGIQAFIGASYVAHYVAIFLPQRHFFELKAMVITKAPHKLVVVQTVHAAPSTFFS